ncbi:unnamed protein product, partial [Durusdinium trenchii]
CEGLIGGFPCQGVSKSGCKRGMLDERSSLVKSFFTLIDQMPGVYFALMENVKHLLSAEMRPMMEYILKEFHRRNFIAKWCVVSGQMAGLHVRRDRVFILASKANKIADVFQGFKTMTYQEMETEAHKCHLFRCQPPVKTWLTNHWNESDASRLRACGNIVIPQCAQLALSILAKLWM